MGIMLLVGQTGQASLGHAAFLAVGCYANVLLQNAGLPFVLSFPLSGVIAGLAGVALAIPTTRLHGIYLAIGTLAISILTDDIIVIAEPLTAASTPVRPDDRHLRPAVRPLRDARLFYWLVLLVTVLVVLAYRNILRSPLGRSFAAVRDSEISAQAMGVNVAKTKTVAFGLSTAITGLAGALMGHFAGIFNNETFTIIISIPAPSDDRHRRARFDPRCLLRRHGGGAAAPGDRLRARSPRLGSRRDHHRSGSRNGVVRSILIVFILFEPMGIYGRWLKIRTYFELFPFYRKDMFRRQKSYLKTERMR